jgi:autotransporter-associated beta strand protein
MTGRSQTGRSRRAAIWRGILAGLVLVAGTPHASAATLLTWDITGSNGSSSGSAASALVLGVSGSVMTSGPGTTLGNTTSPSNTWNRTYTGILATATDSLANGAYVEWTTAASPGYIVTFNGMTGMNLSRTSTGPSNAALFYSTDGGLNFIQTGSSVTVTSTLTSAAPAFGSMMTSTPIVLDGGAGGASILWRLVAFGTGSSRMGIGKAATDDFSLIGSVSGGAARNLRWVGTDGNGIWDTDPGNTAWTTGSSAVAFATNDNVSFTTSGTVAVGPGVAAGSVAVSNASDSLRLEGNGFTGTTLTKSGAGTLVLAAANTLSGGVTVTGGSLVPGAAGAIGTQPLALNGGALSFADPASLSLANAYSTGTAGATIRVPDGTATISGVGTALGTQAGSGIPRGDARTFNPLVKTGTGTLLLTGNLGAQMSYDPAAGNVTTSGGINLQIREGAVEIANNRTWNLATGTAVTTGSTTFNGMQWDGNVSMRGGTIQINGGNIQGSGTIQVGLAGDAVTVNTLQSRLNFAAPSIATTVAIADGFTLTLTSNISSSIRLTGTILGGPTATITNAGNGTATITGTVPSTFAGTFVVTGSQGGMSLTPQAMASAAKVTNSNVLTVVNSVASATTSTLIEGTGLVTVNGAEKVTVSGPNTYSGGTRLLADVGMTKLWDGIDGSLGSGLIWSGNADGRIFWDGPETTVAFTQAVATGGAATDRLAFAGTGKTFVLTGPVSGTGILRASSGAVLDLTQQTAATNTNLGGVEIGNATIRAGSDENLGGGGLLFSGTSAVFVPTSSTTTLARPITIGAAGGSGIAARFDMGSNDLSLSGSIGDAPGTPGGGLTKLGTGRLTITASNSYTGPTVIGQGTLAIAAGGSLATSSTISIAAGATLDVSAHLAGWAVGAAQTLAGSGTVAGSATIGPAATLSPGASPGTLTVTGSTTLASGGNYNWQMLSATGTAGSATAWDLVRVVGPLSIASTSADPFRINLWTLSGIAPDVSGSAANFNSASSYSWTIATATAGISGFAADKFTVVTSAINGTGGFANSFGTGIFSVAQSGNDLNLVFTAGAAPTVITIDVPSGTQTQTQAGYPTLSGSISVLKTGAGTLVLDQANTLSGSTTVQGGVVQLANGSALSASRLVVVAGGTGQVAPVTATSVASLDLASGNGLLDLTSGALTISSGLTATELVAEILEGRGDGSWTGTSGITSSTAAAESAAGTPRAVGWIDNGDGSLTTAYAAPGDTNIDWSIDILDAANFLSGGKFDTGSPAVWFEGDFGYDGIVDILDAADFFATGLYDAGTYNTAPGLSDGVAAVPEPTVSLGLLCPLAAATAAFIRRARSHRSS